ncbi:MAG TPA: DUF2268 domain-containing putative Zn-dependent protease [Anditalea sp.]|nr:DUF2268 domain-containing putative Zn-dependent protease [Anditalea sp.]
MKIIISLLFLYLIIDVAKGQEVKENPYFWLEEAKALMIKQDTLSAIQAMEKSIDYGLFDSTSISSNKWLSFLLHDPNVDHIMKGIAFNKSKLENPENIRVETEDIQRFWKAFESIDNYNAPEVFMDQYIEPGSIGLQTFYQVRMNRDVVKQIRRIRSLSSYYSSIKEATMGFESLRPNFIEAAKKLKKVYPSAYFPPIYFLIGSLTNVGTPDGYGGMLIGTEHLCLHPEVDTSSLSENDRMVLFDIDRVIPIILHEYVHLQQKNKIEISLLEYSIMEGAADFITHLLLGQYTDPKVYEFGEAHEEDLWKHFYAQMDEEDFENWLFNAYNPETGYPGNLGYYIGFKICESYYQQSADKTIAVKNILEIQDYKKFLIDSKYQNVHLSLN